MAEKKNVPEKQRGRIIVIDGSDSSGKHTQTELLADILKSEGKDVVTLDFPQYDSFFGNLVKRYLKGDFGSLDDVKPELASLLYALDRFSQKDNINRWISEGKIIILDRYVQSNMGYQGAKIKDANKKKLFIRWIDTLEHEELGMPRADVVIYLHVPVGISQALMDKRPEKEYLEGEKKDIHESDGSYQSRVVKTYLELCERKGFSKIECVEDGILLDKERISEKIRAVIKSII